MTRTPFSASNFHRRLACPGSLAMERDLPEVETEWSVAGQRLHHAAATGDMTGLEPAEVELVIEKVEQRDKFIASVGLLNGPRILVEHELEYRMPNASFFNHADVIAFNDKVLAIVDYKFGFEEVAAPDLNHQLAVYIAAAAQRWDVAEYYGLIIPRFGRPAPPVRYLRADVAEIGALIEATHDAALTRTTERIAGLRQCRYCKGFELGVCGESRALALAPTELPVPSDPAQVLARLTPDQRTRLFDAFTLATELRQVYAREAKRLVAVDPEFIPGYRLSKEGEVRQHVSDMTKLQMRLADLDVSIDDFLALCEISNKSIKQVVREKTGLKGRALETRIDELTRGLLDTVPVERSLERKAQ